MRSFKEQKKGRRKVEPTTSPLKIKEDRKQTPIAEIS